MTFKRNDGLTDAEERVAHFFNQRPHQWFSGIDLYNESNKLGFSIPMRTVNSLVRKGLLKTRLRSILEFSYFLSK